ncbi:MAG: SGNH/GDSL hydrolase family protein [Acidobacteriaceae bacterium]
MSSAKNAASILPLLLAASFLTHFAHAQPAPNTQAAPNPQVWVASWAASQQIPEPANSIPPGDLRDATLRQLVRLSIGGPTLRVHLSNAFGTEPLRLTSVHIARPLSLASSAIDPQSDRPLTFSGAAAVTVPAGAEVLSDPIDDPVPPLTSLAITFHLDEPPSPETGHPGSRATSYYLHGDQVSAPTLTGATPIEHWYQLAAIDVLAPPSAASIVALGDSTTDGHATTTNGNNRWTDVLAERLQASPPTRNIAVLNQGLGGNHLLTDGLGPNVLARFDRDVLAQTGVRWLIVFEGINDLGGLTRLHEVSPEEHAAFVARILAAYQQIIVRAHAHGIRVIGATITPDGGSDYYHPGPATEADRQAVNAWIRAPGHFDGLIDFDKAIRDPAHADRMLPTEDCGDHLHPNPAGYRAMAEAINLALFTR